MSTIRNLQRTSPGKERNGGHLNTSSIYLGLVLWLGIFLNTVSCNRVPLNRNFVAMEGKHGYNEPQGDHNHVEFSWELSSDNVGFSKVIDASDLEEIVSLLENASNETQVALQPSVQRHKRSSRSTKPKGYRKQVSKTEAQMLPYVATVRVSSGCSGILIGAKHVLTAAHCVYRYNLGKRKGKRKPKVGFLQKDGKVRWRKVRRVHYPRQWRSKKKRQDLVKHDYAVLELKREHGRRGFMKPAHHLNKVVNSKSKIEFNGFPGDKTINTMWHSNCPYISRKGYLLVYNCVAAKGMSGSGTYRFASRGAYTTTGIVAAEVKITIKLKGTSKQIKFIVINPLTHHKTRQISRWMKARKKRKSSRG